MKVKVYEQHKPHIKHKKEKMVYSLGILVLNILDFFLQK